MKLFESYNMEPYLLRNRVVMAPMTRNRADNAGVLPNYAADYYEQRAGAGLIITEATQPSASGRGYQGTPGIHDETQEAQWKRVAEAVHSRGGTIFLQLMHTGRIGHTSLLPDASPLLAPSAVRAKMQVADARGVEWEAEEPRAMTEGEVLRVIDDFVQAAARAVRAGIDGVELHGANGYLLHQFLSHGTNQRTDTFGGSARGRSEFVVRLVERVAETIGPERVGLRISPGGKFNDMRGLDDDETYLELIDRINPAGIAYLHTLRRRSTPLHIQLRQKWSSTFIMNTGYHGASDRDSLEAILTSGDADLVSVGRYFISNPDLVERWKLDLSISEWDEDTLYSGGPRGLIDYPAATN